MFSEDQLSDFQDAFKLFQGNDNTEGIDASSFKTLVRALGFCASEEELDAMIQDIRAIKGNNCMIAFDDFILSLTKQLERSIDNPNCKIIIFRTHFYLALFKLESLDRDALAQQLIDAFRVFDPSNVGYIQKDELKKQLTTLGERLTDAEADMMLRDADPNNTGKIDYAQFVKTLLAQY